MRILITGICGFAGHHLAEHILKNTDWEIVSLDHLTYASKGFDRLRDINVYDDKRVRVFTHDISQRFSDGLIQEIGSIDYVAHLAAYTHVDNSIRDPRPFVLSNVLGTFELLDLSVKHIHPKAFVYFSTDEVFGPASFFNPPGGHPGLEGTRLEQFVQYQEWDRYNCTNPYSATKAGGEELCLAYANTYKLPVIITHCMNLFGERQHPEKFIPLVIRSVLDGKKVSIHADKGCKQSGLRSYIHARNAADAVLHLLTRVPIHGRDKYNIAGDCEMSNFDLALLIANYMNKPLIHEFVDFHSSRPGHDLRYALDGSKLARTGWKSPVGFESSLQKTLDWYLSNMSWLNA